MTMTDITLSNIGSGYNLNKINDNFQTIQEVVNDEILHTEGGNNTMRQALDMNSKPVINGYTDVSDPKQLLTVEAADARYLSATEGGVDFETTFESLAGINSISSDDLSHYDFAVYRSNGHSGIRMELRKNNSATWDSNTPGYGGVYFEDSEGNKWEVINTDTVHLKWFGAAGDGVTDDGPAIRAFFNYLASAKIYGGTGIIDPASNYYSIQTPDPRFAGSGSTCAFAFDPTINPVAPSVFVGGLTIEGHGYSSRIQLDYETNTDHALLCTGQSVSFLSFDEVYIDSLGHADYTFSANEYYYPFLTLNKTMMRNGIVAQYNLATYVAKLSEATAFGGEYGFLLESPPGTPGPGTSMTIDSCYSLNASVTGFKCGYLTYCVFNACAVDADDSMPVAYDLGAAYGVTMNACGCEAADAFLRVTTFRGLTINSAFMLRAGALSGETPTPYLIELQGGTDATISGFRVENIKSGASPGNYEYKLGVTGNSFGSENVTVTDRSIRRDEIYQVSNFAFERPIKLLRSDESNKSETVNIATMQELRDYFSRISYYTINHNVTLQLADGVYEFGLTPETVQSIQGCGVLTIQGNASDREAVQLNTNFRLLVFKNITCGLYLKNLSISASVANNANDRLLLEACPKTTLDNVLLKRDGLNASSAIVATLGTRVVLAGGSEADSHAFAHGVYDVDDSSEIVLPKRVGTPTTGGWDAGQVFYYLTPTAGGHMGEVCTVSGTPGTWKTFGSVTV